MEEASEDTWEETLKIGVNLKTRTISETIGRTTLENILKSTRMIGTQNYLRTIQEHTTFQKPSAELFQKTLQELQTQELPRIRRTL